MVNLTAPRYLSPQSQQQQWNPPNPQGMGGGAQGYAQQTQQRYLAPQPNAGMGSSWNQRQQPRYGFGQQAGRPQPQQNPFAAWGITPQPRPTYQQMVAQYGAAVQDANGVWQPGGNRAAPSPWAGQGLASTLQPQPVVPAPTPPPTSPPPPKPQTPGFPTDAEPYQMYTYNGQAWVPIFQQQPYGF